MPSNVIILIPVYQDWNALMLLLNSLDKALLEVRSSVSVLVVDDGSTMPLPEALRSIDFQRIRAVDLLRLKRNLGHQRALATGLCYIAAEPPCPAVLLMDGDGEDAPSDVPRLLAEFDKQDGKKIVFAERLKRSESLLFRVFYQLYRLTHYLLTGISVRVGNFSVVPGSFVPSLAVVSDLWNHYAASVFKSRLPFVTLPTQRAHRLEGQSHMNFTALVTHGLSAISVFQDRVGIRLLFVITFLMTLTSGALLVTILIRLTTSLAIPGWATSTATSLIQMLLQMCVLVTCFVVMILGARNSVNFLPIRDCQVFVDRKERLFPHDG